jgi:hypothetical protein
MHGHLTDRGAFERMDEPFTPDAEFDLNDFGLGGRTGPASMNEAIRAIEEHPVGHHVTNIVLSEGDDGAIQAISKGIGIGMNGHCGSVVYEDVLRTGPAGCGSSGGRSAYAECRCRPEFETDSIGHEMAD